MFLKIILIYILLWCCYSILPTIYFKFIYKETYPCSELLLTFDDGPNPMYTEQVLAILKQHNTKACFFVIAEKVEKYPDIIKKIHQEGHEIGLHCYHHTHPVLWGIWKTKQDMQKSKQILESHGIKPSYYRPPHGWVNLAMIIISKKWNLPLKLWTCIVGDWKEDKNWKEIYDAMLKEKQTGGVICLHDSNHKVNSPSKAPENTIFALDEYFKKCGDTTWKKNIKNT
jgi:polysaccharide deacetylase